MWVGSVCAGIGALCAQAGQCKPPYKRTAKSARQARHAELACANLAKQQQREPQGLSWQPLGFAIAALLCCPETVLVPQPVPGFSTQLTLGWAAVKGHAADAAHIVACAKVAAGTPQ